MRDFLNSSSPYSIMIACTVAIQVVTPSLRDGGRGGLGLVELLLCSDIPSVFHHGCSWPRCPLPVELYA